MTNFERIKNMTLEEMAEFFAINKYPNFPSSPCYICEYDSGLTCVKPSDCTNKDKIWLYKKWLLDEFTNQPKNECEIKLIVESCKECGLCNKK